ncbi:MAG: (Fe-S)-binding protein [Nitrospirae bacterium]|nr:(Fe-S)-binding protein [Nitrospirota bacterium]
MNYLSSVKDEIYKCIKCGTCMTGCPTFGITRDETMVARGRINLVGAVLDGRIETTERFEGMITSCIGCLTCDTNCPTGVKVSEIIFAAKAHIADKSGLGIIEKIASKIVLRLRWPLPLMARMMSVPVKIYEMLPVNGLFSNAIPFVRKNIKRKLPEIGSPPLSSLYPELIRTTKANKKGTVAFYPGCVMELSKQAMGKATISVLNKLGYDVIIPKGQFCCGSPLLSLGDRETAKKLARKNVKIFSKLNVEAIVVSCATCGNMLKKEYPVLLSPPLEKGGEGGFDVQAFSDKITDVHEFIFEPLRSRQFTNRDEKPHPHLNPLPEGEEISLPFKGRVRVGMGSFPNETNRVTFHDPCHLKKGLGIYQEPRDILKSIPSVDFVNMEDSDACCGFGGIFSVYHYDLASQIGEKKAENIKKTGAKIVATGCPGCAIHIEDSLNRLGYNAEVKHTVELLDESLN